MSWRAVLTTLFVLVVAAVFFLWRLGDYDLDRREREPFDFVSAGTPVSGTLWLPEGALKAAVVLVHGDGAQDRTSAGGYAPLINTMLDQGIAVASWDKPGVGASEGNWLRQTMEDRADETRVALQHLARRFDGLAYGAVGFSQAGWVLPQLSPDNADFIVLIGAAVEGHYESDGYELLTYAKGNRGVRFIFEKTGGDAAAPQFIQFSDHRIAPADADHYHLYWGDDRAALLEELTNWPTYYSSSLDSGQIVDEMLAH